MPRKIALRISGSLILLVLSPSFIISAFDSQFVHDWSNLLFGLVPVLLALSAAWAAYKLKSDARFLFCAILLFLISRAVWIALVPTEPVSDFATYHRFGEIFSRFEPLEFEIRSLSLNMTAQPWGYPFSLGLVYATFGPKLLAAKLLNVLAGAATMIVLFSWSRSLAGSRGGRATACIFLFWPAQLMFSSVLASEHLGLLCVATGFYLLSKGVVPPKSDPRTILFAAAALSMAVFYRYPNVVAVIAAASTLVLTSHSVEAGLKKSVLLTCSFLLFLSLLVGGLFLIYHKVSTPTASLNLLLGTNYDSNGDWNLEDAQRYSSYQNLDDANKFALETAVQRVKSSPGKFARLVIKKVMALWHDDGYAAYWSTSDLPSEVTRNRPALAAISHVYYLFIIALVITSCIGILKSGAEKGILLPLLFVLGTTALHAVLVCTNRYNYTALALMTVLPGPIARHRIFKSTGSAAQEWSKATS